MTLDITDLGGWYMKKIVIGVGLVVLLLPGILSAADWTEKVKVKGNLRFRYDMIDVEDMDTRNRLRIRARFGIEAEPTDFLDVGLQLASGSGDPVSTNQTLDDIRLDLAYFDLHSKRAPGLNIIGGKLKNPFHKPGKTELIWDSDLNPEGLVFKYAGGSDKVEFFGNAGFFSVEERSSDKNTHLFGIQGGVEISPVTVGFSYYDYTDIQGFAPIFDDEDPFGNTVFEDEDGNLYYAYDYNLIEVFTELNFDVNEFPIWLFGDFIQNTASGVIEKQGWLVGTKLGKVKDPGSFEIRYLYRRVRNDAVLGIFNDSDFIGGGTDGKGHELGIDLQAAKSVMVAATYFINERRLTEGGEDFNRLLLDFNFKF
jgi:hypothetical protein